MITDSLLNEYSRMFVSRRDDYAIQQLNGRYLRVGSPLTKIALLNHLNGAQSLGTYVIDERGRCRFAVFDADAHHGLDVLLGMQGQMALDGIPSYLERSRRGGHLWVLLGLSRPKLALALLPCRCRILSQAGRGQRLRLAHPPAARDTLALGLPLSVRGVDGRLAGRSGSDHQ